MADGNDLDAIFARAGERRRTQREAADRAKQRRKEALRVIEKVIRPELEALVKELRARGQNAGIDRNESTPSVGLLFKPARSQHAGSHLDFSRLHFSTRDDACFWTHEEIRAADGFPSRDGPHDAMRQTRAFEKVDAGWVRALGLAFVEAVLQEN